MAVHSTWQIETIQEATSKLNIWKITNVLTGEVSIKPVPLTDLNLDITSSTDYNFVFNKYKENQLNIPIVDLKYIGSSGTPNYGSPSTDLASIFALLN